MINDPLWQQALDSLGITRTAPSFPVNPDEDTARTAGIQHGIHDAILAYRAGEPLPEDDARPLAWAGGYNCGVDAVRRLTERPDEPTVMLPDDG